MCSRSSAAISSASARERVLGDPAGLLEEGARVLCGLEGIGRRRALRAPAVVAREIGQRQTGAPRLQPLQVFLLLPGELGEERRGARFVPACRAAMRRASSA